MFCSWVELSEHLGPDNDNAFILFHTTQSSVLYLIWMWRDRTKPGKGEGTTKMSANMGIVCVYLCLCTMNVRRRVFRFFWWQSFASPCLLFCPSFAHILPVTAKSKITLIVEYIRAFLHLVISITFEMNKTGDFNFVLFIKVLPEFQLLSNLSNKSTRLKQVFAKHFLQKLAEFSWTDFLPDEINILFSWKYVFLSKKNLFKNPN